MATIDDEAVITKGITDGDGNTIMDISFSGCTGCIYGPVSDKEVNLFKQGVLTERERIWNGLSEILNGKAMAKIGESDLFSI